MDEQDVRSVSVIGMSAAEIREKLQGLTGTGQKPVFTMTESQEAHLHGLKETFTRMVDKKYRSGAEEHGGDIRDLTALQAVDEAILESIDQFVYLNVLRQKLIDIQMGAMSMGSACESLVGTITGTEEA